MERASLNFVFCQSPPGSNRLLGALAECEMRVVEPHLELVRLMTSRPLYYAGDPIRHIYFPLSGFVSILYTDRSGASMAVALIGCEGMVGLSPLLGHDTAFSGAVVSVAGMAYRLPLVEARRIFIDGGHLHPLLLRFAHLRILQLSQAAVCNRHHSLEQQLCSWLLQAVDRVPGKEVRITHESIAMLLGVRRQGITEAALALQELGLIRHSRGCITLLDLAALQRRSCECHAILRNQTEDFFSNLPGCVPSGARRREIGPGKEKGPSSR